MAVYKILSSMKILMEQKRSRKPNASKPITIKTDFVKSIKKEFESNLKLTDSLLTQLFNLTGGFLEIAKAVIQKQVIPIESINKVDLSDVLEEVSHEVIQEYTQSIVESLKKNSQQAAIELIYVLASLSPDFVPIDIFELGKVYLGNSLSEKCQVSRDIHETIKRLMVKANKQFEIILLTEKNGLLGLTLIPPFYDSFREFLKNEKQDKTWLRHVLLTINEAFPDPDHTHHSNLCELLLPHASELYSFVTENKNRLTYSWRFLPRMATYLKYLGRYQFAREISEAAVDLISIRFGPSHPVVAPPKRILAGVQSYLGQHENAQKNFNDVIDIYMLGLIRSYTNYAEYYLTIGDFTEQEKCLKEAVQIARIVSKQNKYPHYLSQCELGDYYSKIGSLDRALQLFEKLKEKLKNHVENSLEFNRVLLTVSNSISKIKYLKGEFTSAEQEIDAHISTSNSNKNNQDLMNVKAKLMYTRARIYQARADYNNALFYYNEAVAWYDDHQYTHLEKVKVHIRKASIFQELGHHSSADDEIEIAQKCLDLSFGTEQFEKVKHPIWSSFFRVKALISFSRGNYNNAIKFLTDSQNYIGPSIHPDHGKIYLELAIVHIEIASFIEAQRFLDKASKIFNEKLPNNEFLKYKVNLLRGMLSYKKEEDNKAIEIFSEIIDVKGKINDQDYALALLYRGLVFHQIDDYKKAQDDMQKALEVLLRLFENKEFQHPRIAHVYNCLARMNTKYNLLHKENSDNSNVYEMKANAYYEYALNIRMSLEFEPAINTENTSTKRSHPDLAWTYNGLAKLNQILRNYKKAKLYYKKTLRVRCQTIGISHPDYSWSLSNLGLLNLLISKSSHNQKHKANNLDISRKRLEKALTILPNEHKDSLYEIHRLLNLAQYFLFIESYDEASTYLDRAETIFQIKYPHVTNLLISKIKVCRFIALKKKNLIQPALSIYNQFQTHSLRDKIYIEFIDQEISVKEVLNSLSSSKGEIMKKVVVELDLVGYSSISSILEQNLDPQAVLSLNQKIQEIIDQALQISGCLRSETVMSTTGDGAILVFDQPNTAHIFAQEVHRITKEQNQGKTELSSLRLFRIGAATGDIIMQSRPNGGYDIAGMTIARAVRLEGAANSGEFLIDIETFSSLAPNIQIQYRPEEQVKGKRDEIFSARRCLMYLDVPNHIGANPIGANPVDDQKKASQVVAQPKANRREVLELFGRLSPRDQLDKLLFLLEVPLEYQPSKTLSLADREQRLLEYQTSHQNGLERVVEELCYLLGRSYHP